MSRGVGKTVDVATFGGPRGFFTSFLPSNIGNKTLNSFDIEKNLVRNLDKLSKLEAQLDDLPREEVLNVLRKLAQKAIDVAGKTVSTAEQAGVGVVTDTFNK